MTPSSWLASAAATVLLFAVFAVSTTSADRRGSLPTTQYSSFEDDDLRDLVRDLALEDAELPVAVRNWYASEELPLLWGSPESGPSDALREILERSHAEGLAAEDVERESLVRDLGRLDPGAYPDSVRARAELRLTDGLLRVAGTYLRGNLREENEVDWEMPRDPAPGVEILHVAATEGPEAALDSVRPLLPVYDRTIEAMSRLRDHLESRGEWPKVASDGVASPGDSAGVVETVRLRLAHGIVDEERELARAGEGTPALFDASLAGAVARFQSRHGIAIDSVIGAETVAAMNVSLEERIGQLRLNLDRLRWLPRDLGERAILVNVAGFELRVLEANVPVMKMAVVVGQPSWRTAVFSDTIEHLIVNPYWHVPESIEAAETLPAVKADPGYLDRKRISVVPADDNFGAPVDPTSIDWSSVSAASMPWDFRQEPGPDNALGQIKFMFPNRHNIYLHDTPADQLFEKNFRAFSHGCIRVERPWDLASYIVRHATDRGITELEAVRTSRERTRIDLTSPIPVHVAYLTTWVDEDGRVSFHEDLYDRDDAVLTGSDR